MSFREFIGRGRRLRLLHLRIAALVVTFVTPVLLFAMTAHEVLTIRECAIGMLAWFVASNALAVMIRREIKLARIAKGPQPEVPLDERTRKRILRRIRGYKIWVGLLLFSLPFGVAEGIKEHFGIALLGPVAINQALMWISIREIRRLRRLLDRGTIEPPL